MFVDSHIHLTHRLYDYCFPCFIGVENNQITYEERNRENLISEIKNSGCEFVVEPGIGLESNAKILKYASENKGFILPAIGVHPTRTPNTKWKSRKIIEELSQDENVVAIGELGLDYHYAFKDQHRLKQFVWFVWQLNLAHKRELPLVLHIRNADKDAIRILKHFNKKNKLHGGVCHCFNGNSQIAKIYTNDFGLMLGIGASILYGNKELEQAVIDTPLEYLLLETDGPYVSHPKTENLSNKQYRKIRNNSLLLPIVASKIAELKGIETDEVFSVTTENARRLFCSKI